MKFAAAIMVTLALSLSSPSSFAAETRIKRLEISTWCTIVFRGIYQELRDDEKEAANWYRDLREKAIEEALDMIIQIDPSANTVEKQVLIFAKWADHWLSVLKNEQERVTSEAWEQTWASSLEGCIARYE